MKLCQICETPLPDNANVCAQCGALLPDASEVTIRQAPILFDERTVSDIAVLTEVEEVTIKGWPVPVIQEEMTIKGYMVPNPETPIPDMAAIENLPTVENSNGILAIEHVEDAITDDPTPEIYDEKTIANQPVPVLLAEQYAAAILDDPTPAPLVAQDAAVIPDDLTPDPLIAQDATVITDDPPPPLPGALDAAVITDDPTPASLVEHDADVITDDPMPLLEHQSDTAIIRADAPVRETDPRLSTATIDALALLNEVDDDPTPGNGHSVEQIAAIPLQPVASFLETGEETPVQNGHAIPAPLYPDFGKASHTLPTPLYEERKQASNGLTANVPTLPGRASTTYAPIWSRRSLIAIALCLLIIVGSIGLIITKKSQTSGGPTTHTIAAKLRLVSTSLTIEAVKGHKVIQPDAIINDGGQALRWTADAGNTPWLSINRHMSSPIIPPGAPQETFYINADATLLNVGSYSGSVQIHSNGGDASIQVTLHVLAATGKLQPIITVDQSLLTFNSLPQGQQATQTVYIGNTGPATLNWKASVDQKGITLTPTSGTIPAGGYPQPLEVTINTAGMSIGFITASLNITSNASNTLSPVTLTVNVTAANGNALSIAANPGSFTNGCLTCTVMLKASQGGQGAQTSVQWSASAAGVPGITFNPATGTLLAGQSMPVTVTVPNTTCPASANFNFTVPGTTVSVLWSCTPTPTANAILTASPTSLSNCYTCTVSISPAAGSPGSLKWTSNSSGINGIHINPASGTVAAGSSQTVTITVPNTNCPSNANNATITFYGQGAGNSVPVSWACTPPSPLAPQLSVSPTSLNTNSSQCSSNGNNTYNCTVTLSENPAGNLNWSSYTNVGGTFSQPTGSFSSGLTQTTITINNILCQNGTFGFTGTNTSAAVQWTCQSQQTPTLSVSPNSLNGNSSACSSDGNGGYNCNVKLTENPQGTLAWQESDNLGVSVSQQSGTLSPGNSSATITLFSIPCQSTGTNDTFTFSAAGSNASVSWSCTAPPTVTTPPTTVVPSTPAAPSNISATATGSSTILVTWNDNSNDETGFHISNGSTSVDVAANTTSYTWGGLTGGTNMCFNVSAFNSAGSSASTPNACATTLQDIPAAPSNVSATATSSSSIVVTWSDNSNNETGFSIYNGSTSVTVAANTTSYTWGGLAGGTYMCFNVSAFNSAGSSASTPYACATTNPTQTVPAMLSVSSSSYPNASGCSYTSGSGWTCTETLSVNADATQNLTWNVSASSSDIQFSPNGTTMTPGQQLQVTITIPDRYCPVNESFTFTATNQTSGINVGWNCNATLAYSWEGCTTPDNGQTYLCNIGLYLATGSQGKMNWNISTSTSSDKIIPYSQGTLKSGGTDLITVQTGCYDTITITGTGNSPMTQTWACK